VESICWAEVGSLYPTLYLHPADDLDKPAAAAAAEVLDAELVGEVPE
jgi:hypothetical protein